jgi:hypothetical protein
MADTADELLSLLSEDYYGAWEIAIQVPAERGLLVAAIDTLVRQGFAEWFVRVNDSAEAVRLAETSGDVPSLNDELAWAAPSLDSPQLLLGATEVGLRAYFGRGVPNE